MICCSWIHFFCVAAENMEMMNEPIRCIPNKIKLFSGPGTRQWPRFNVADVPLIREIRSNTGSKLRIINISRGGAFLWTKRRLTRGARIKFKVITSEEAFPLAGSVLRSLVFASKWIPRYQTAVAFDRPLKILDHDSKPSMDTELVTAVTASPSDEFPHEGDTSFRGSSYNADLPVISDFGALNLWSERYTQMRDELKLNNW